MNNKITNLKIGSFNKNEKTKTPTNFFMNKIKNHQKRLFIIGSTMILFSITYFFYEKNKSTSEKIAQTEMSESILLFEKENYTDAINGTESSIGLISLSKKYNGTQAANLANLYIGISFMNLKDYDKAIDFFKKTSFKDSIMQARTLALIGDAYVEKGNYKSALLYYENAANTKPNKSYSPIYLEKAALTYEIDNNKAKALQCYETIYQKYPMYETATIIKHIERLKISQ